MGMITEQEIEHRPRKVEQSSAECDLCGLPSLGRCIHCRNLPRAKDIAREAKRTGTATVGEAHGRVLPWPFIP